MAARRRTSRKPATRRRSTSKPMISLLSAAESYMLANAALQATAGVNPVEFVTGKVNGNFNPGADGYSIVTLPELLGFSKSGWSLDKIGGEFGTKTAMDALRYNFNKNGAAAIGAMIAVPVAFRLARKALGKPLINPANRLLKQAGIASVVKV